jgi:N-acetyl sugar amidotransferase
MKYCARCLYPANHPWYITFDDQGICSGCRVHEEKDILPWDARLNKLSGILDGYRDKSGSSFDCVIPVSGDGDSHFIVHTITKIFKMNPLLVSFNQQYNTKIGIRNLANLLTKLDCDHIQYTLSPELIKKLVRSSLKKFGSMYWFVLAGRLTFPVQVAVKFKIPLIIWGVNPWLDQVGKFSHLDEVEMTEKIRKEHSLFGYDAKDMIDEKAGITKKDVQPFVYPFDEELERVGVRGIYLGNYIRWDSTKQHELMIKNYGYETCKQERTFNTYEDVGCFHSAGLNDYIKFLKYGYGKATDHAAREIRFGRMSREEGIDLVKQYDAKKPKDLGLFLDWLGISEKDFYSSIDPHRDPRIWNKDASGKWSLLDSVANHVSDKAVDSGRLKKTEEHKFIVTASREPKEQEDAYVLMGRGYIDRYNYQAVKDDQDTIQRDLPQLQEAVQVQVNKLWEEDLENKLKLYKPKNLLRYCKRCVMPNMKPGVFLDEEGICSACRSVERKKNISWEQRHNELKAFCDKIRGSNGNGYECLVPVSGGKDSFYQAWIMKEVYKLKVLASIVVPHLQTREGIYNLNNLVTSLGVDLIKISLKPSIFKEIRKKAFFEIGNPNWADHRSVFSGVARIGQLYHIPLVVWGEDIAVEFGGATSEKQTASAEDLINNDLFRDAEMEFFYNDTVNRGNTFFYQHPSKEDLIKRKLSTIYLGYYDNWDGYKHYELSKRYGFHSRELGCLSGNVIDYDNIDEKLCEIHIWLKFLKFGFWRPTDQCCYHIWNGRMTREEAVKLVNEQQYEFPVEYLRDFLEFHQITEEEFWRTMEKFRNKDIWERANGKWRLRVPLE